MWLKWFPWKFIVKRVALAQGFVDPIHLLSRFNRFAQPSEVLAPVELMRAGAVLHARGFINSQVIQHNLDWVWPYWVVRQFDPNDPSFIPRAFSLTHINLTHRNWTAVGFPGLFETPLVDPRGLVMPFFDSWSLDCWIIGLDGTRLIPSQTRICLQKMELDPIPSVITEVEREGFCIRSRVYAELFGDIPVCRIEYSAKAPGASWLVIALRPCNPEGISFIHDISVLSEERNDGWRINKQRTVSFSVTPEYSRFSNYQHGDVYHWVLSSSPEMRQSVECDVGMATAMVAYKLDRGEWRSVHADIPLSKGTSPRAFAAAGSSAALWTESLENRAKMNLGFERFELLFDTALRTMVLFTPEDALAGPYTYKRFWFRDAAFTVQALLCSGLARRAAKVIEGFFPRQNISGYFVSQEGEWDSNGEALWAMNLYCKLTGTTPPSHWHHHIHHACEWIRKKRLPLSPDSMHAGLLPPGFSAEHLGPNDHYYWDNFWSVAGLHAGASMMLDLGDEKGANAATHEAHDLLACIERSLTKVAGPMRRHAMPASPYRRLDSGAVGSLVAGYPLQLWEMHEERLLLTADYLFNNCLSNGAFYHDISHSGINPYLTLHIAQVLMRAGDRRFFSLVNAIGSLASPTGQWPEAIHPQIGSGCMGDGQHVWAAAEWIMMMRNGFVREESGGRLVLCEGISDQICRKAPAMSFGPAPTSFGTLTVNVERKKTSFLVTWLGEWFSRPPMIEIAFPGLARVNVPPDHHSVEVPIGKDA